MNFYKIMSIMLLLGLIFLFNNYRYQHKRIDLIEKDRSGLIQACNKLAEQLAAEKQKNDKLVMRYASQNTRYE